MSGISFFLLLIAISFTSCEKGNEGTVNPLDGLVKLCDGYATGASAKVEIWGTKNFFAGYNKLNVVLYDSLNTNMKITDAHITFMPVMTMTMDMMTHEHSSPVENPDVLAVSGVFPGAVIFIMPSTDEGKWKLTVGVHNHKYDKEGEAEFEIKVDNPDYALIKSFVSQSPDSTKLFVSLIQPSDPKVGVNDNEFTIHSMAGMMSFPPEDGYTIDITPEMPSMGHGSPNNVNPVSTGNGHYKGKVNFTMTGEWRINLVIRKEAAAISNGLYFDLMF